CDAWWIHALYAAVVVSGISYAASEEFSPSSEWLPALEPAAAPRSSADFTWGSTQAMDEWREPLEAHVDGFDPWSRLPWARAGRDEGLRRHAGLGDPLIGTS